MGSSAKALAAGAAPCWLDSWHSAGGPPAAATEGARTLAAKSHGGLIIFINLGLEFLAGSAFFPRRRPETAGSGW